MRNSDDVKETKFLNLDFFMKDKLPILQRNFSNVHMKKLASNSQKFDQKLKPLLNRFDLTKSMTNLSDMISHQKITVKIPELNSKRTEFNLDSKKSPFHEVVLLNEQRNNQIKLNNIFRKRVSFSTSEKRSNEKVGQLSKKSLNKTRSLFNEGSLKKYIRDQDKIDNNNQVTPDSFKAIERDRSFKFNKLGNTFNLSRINNSISLENCVGLLNKLDLSTGIGANCSGIKIEKLKEIQNEVLTNLKYKKGINQYFLRKHNFPRNIKFNLNKILCEPVNRFRDINFKEGHRKYIIFT